MTTRQYATLDDDGQLDADQIPASVDHPNLATHDALGLATDAELSTHAATTHGTTAHTISGVLHTGTLDHASLGTVTANQHHNESHKTRHESGGADELTTLPSAGQKNALAGTSGTPGTGNEYVTTQDARNADARTPTAHVTSHHGGSDPVTPAGIGAATSGHNHTGTYEPSGTVATHEADSTAVHGITDTSALLKSGDAAGGQLAGTYPNPTVAASHSGSTHAATQAAAEATAASALSTHAAAADPHTGYLTAAEGNAAYQPLDSDLTAVAALTTTAYGRAFLALADAAAGRTALALGTAATAASGDFQPIDSDLTAIAALTTTTFGRSLLTLADAAALASAHTHSGASTAYAPGSFTVADGNYALMVKRLQLTTTQRVTLAGSGRLRIT